MEQVSDRWIKSELEAEVRRTRNSLKAERDKALKLAYAFARNRHFKLAQTWVDRANQFWPVTQRQLAYVNKLAKNTKR